MKKILMIFLFLVLSVSNTFAVETSVGVKCGIDYFLNPLPILLEGNNTNNSSNTNTSFACLTQNLNGGEFVYKIYNNNGILTNTLYLGGSTGISTSFTKIKTINNIFLVTSNTTYQYNFFTVVVFNRNTGGSYILNPIYPNVISNNINTAFNFQYNATIPVGFTTRNGLLEIGTSSNSFNYNLITNIFGTGAGINFDYQVNNQININLRGDPLLKTKFDYLEYYVDNNSNVITVNKGNNTLDFATFDNISNIYLQTQNNLLNTPQNIYNFNRADLNEYYLSEGFTIYQRAYNSNTSIRSFSGYLSYISGSGTNIKLHTLPQSIYGNVDYNINGNIIGWVSGTGSNERFWYLKKGELFFNGDLALIKSNIYNTTVSVDITSTNTGGLITFNNTGTGGSLSSLFTNANAGSGSFLPDKLNFIFNTAITKVNSGGLSSTCNPMFDNTGIFNYTKGSQSEFIINLSAGNILTLGARWNMEILGVNVIGWLYDLLDWILTMIQQIFGTILNGFFGLFSDITGAVNIPARNANYCFLGTNIYLADNIKSYYSYSQKKKINISGLNSIEMFYIFLLTMFLFVLVIKL